MRAILTLIFLSLVNKQELVSDYDEYPEHSGHFKLIDANILTDNSTCSYKFSIYTGGCHLRTSNSYGWNSYLCINNEVSCFYVDDKHLTATIMVTCGETSETKTTDIEKYDHNKENNITVDGIGALNYAVYYDSNSFRPRSCSSTYLTAILGLLLMSLLILI